MKPDIYLGGEKQSYLKYEVPRKFESFFNEKMIFITLVTIAIMLTIAELVS
ncbi:MAG: hypothetical protein QXO69_03290 [archaeon]